MTVRQRTVVAGALFGLIGGACAAIAVMWIVPSVGHPVTLRQLPRHFGWAIFYSWPTGPAVGAGAGAFLHWRAQGVSRFWKLLLETSALAAVTAGTVVQVVLPVAWELPRMKITLIAVLAAAGLAAIGTVVLKPIYWRARPVRTDGRPPTRDLRA